MKYLKQGLLVLLLSVIVELLYFNFHSIVLRLDPGLISKSYTLSQMEYVNWSRSGDILVSEQDPMLIIHDINCFIETVTIQFNTDKDLESVTVFYTNDENTVFNGNAYFVATGAINSQCGFEVNEHIRDLRIDLGDLKGTVLYDAKVLINDDTIDFSLSRVIAMVLIYFAAVFLFNIQKMPDYNLDQFINKGTNIDEK